MRLSMIHKSSSHFDANLIVLAWSQFRPNYVDAPLKKEGRKEGRKKGGEEGRKEGKKGGEKGKKPLS